MMEPSVAADHAAGQMVANAGPHNDWADQFSNLRLDHGGQPAAWADDFAKVGHALIHEVAPCRSQLLGQMIF